jgi:uncharacterized protein (DUF1778 family)
MKAPGDISPDITTLKPCDHQVFFDALDSPASPTEALRAAFRRAKARLPQRNTGLPTTD